MAASAKQRAEQQRRRELTDKALAFYTKHNVTETVEKLLNEMFLAEPRDVYGYMSNYLSDMALAPVISGARCTESVDERGDRALEISIHCTVHGVDKFVASVSVPVNPHPPPPPPPSPSHTTSPGKAGAKKKGQSQAEPVKTAPEGGEEGSGAQDKENDASYALESFNTYIAPALVSRPPTQQSEIDNAITALRDKDGKELHPSALLGASLAVAKSAAVLSNLPLYNHLTSTLSPNSSSSSSSPLSLPTPLTSLLTCGCGKLRTREFCILPLPGRTLQEQIFALGSVYNSVGTLLSARTGAAGGGVSMGPRGAYVPPLDKLEVGLELVGEAASLSGLTLGQDISVVVDIGADRLFDQEKRKYELVTGQWKSTDEIISVYTELLTSHPGVMGFIDPLHPKDVQGWRKLQEALGNRCLIVADRALDGGLPIKHTREQEVEEQTENSEGTHEDVEGLEFLSCASLTLEKTISDTFSRRVSLSGTANYIMLCVPPTLAVNPLHLDLAVAMQCGLLRMGPPCGVTSTYLLSRMLQIRDELSSKGTYKPAKALVFSSTSLSQLDQQEQ